MIDVEDFMARYHEIDNPYEFYDQMRSLDRVLWIPTLNRWLVTGHRQAMTLIRHEKTSSDRRNWADYQLPPGLDRPPGGMYATDPPSHTRLRSLVQQAFTPKLVQRLRSGIEKLTDDLLTRAAEHGEIDLMAEIAYPLPAIVLAQLLGVPPEDHEQFRSWLTTFMDTFDPVSHRISSDVGAQAHADLERYLRRIVEERRQRPRDDLITGLVRAEEDGERLSGEELLEMCMLLTVAGLETTANLIGNGISALFDHPDQMDRLRTHPELIETAVEELIRYDAPIQLSGRVVMDTIEIDGHVLRRGQMAGILLGAANRDPAAFDEPNHLDLGRRPNNHLGFGRGIHFCLGAPLARLEGAITLTALVTRFPKLRPAGDPKRRANVHVRGHASMPVAFT
jgi:Cytochrome P450